MAAQEGGARANPTPSPTKNAPTAKSLCWQTSPSLPLPLMEE